MLRQLHPQGKIALDTMNGKLSRLQLLSGGHVDKPLAATGIEQRPLGLNFWLNCLKLKCKQHELEYFLNKKELPSLETQAWLVLPFLSRNIFALFYYSGEIYIHLTFKKNYITNVTNSANISVSQAEVTCSNITKKAWLLLLTCNLSVARVETNWLKGCCNWFALHLINRKKLAVSRCLSAHYP